jgi:hypothetical protein
MRLARDRQDAQASVEYVGLIALAAVLLVGGAAVAARAPSRSPGAAVDRLMAASLDEFLAQRRSASRDARLDWSSDLCSAPIVGSSGESFDFTQACLRHDFGYRNYGRLGRFDERREAVDERFLEDMRDHCATRLAWELVRCMAWARTFYVGVRAFGWTAGPD